MGKSTYLVFFYMVEIFINKNVISFVNSMTNIKLDMFILSLLGLQNFCVPYITLLEIIMKPGSNNYVNKKKFVDK